MKLKHLMSCLRHTHSPSFSSLGQLYSCKGKPLNPGVVAGESPDARAGGEIAACACSSRSQQELLRAFSQYAARHLDSCSSHARARSKREH